METDGTPADVWLYSCQGLGDACLACNRQPGLARRRLCPLHQSAIDRHQQGDRKWTEMGWQPVPRHPRPLRPRQGRRLRLESTFFSHKRAATREQARPGGQEEEEEEEEEFRIVHARGAIPNEVGDTATTEGKTNAAGNIRRRPCLSPRRIWPDEETEYLQLPLVINTSSSSSSSSSSSLC